MEDFEPEAPPKRALSKGEVLFGLAASAWLVIGMVFIVIEWVTT